MQTTSYVCPYPTNSHGDFHGNSEEFYGNYEAINLAEDILGKADLAGKRTVEMDTQILRELLWHIDEEYNTGSGSLEHYLAKKKREAEEVS